MFDLASIRDMNRQATAKAKRERSLPLVLTQVMIDRFRREPTEAGFTFPHVGDRVPRGFKLVDTMLCDSSGWGSSYEPALTLTQLGARLKVGMAYATTEIGQFQLYLGEFFPPDTR